MSTSAVTIYYENMVDSLKEKFGNVEPFLLIKSSMLARKYPSERSQRFCLEHFYREGMAGGEKARQIYELVGKLPSIHGKGHYQIDLQTDIDTVLVIARDRDLEWMGGDVYPS